MNKLLIIALCVVFASCAIVREGALIEAYNAHKKGKYKKTIQLVSQALGSYKYSDETRADMLFIKADSYAQINDYASALGVLTYIINTYPDSEAAHKASILLMSTDQFDESEKMDHSNAPVLQTI